MYKPVFLAALAAIATNSLAASAQEQPWLGDRRYGEGMGIRTGDLELHPGIAAEGGYDSNYFQRSGEDREPVISTIRLRVTPSFSVSTLGPQRRALDGEGAEPPTVEFRASTSGSYNEFIATDSQYRSEASRQRNFSGRIGFKLDILPQRPWGGDLLADFQRTVEPSNELDRDYGFDRDTARFGTGIIWRPGGGLFDWRLGYELRYNHFERQSYRRLDNTHHYINTRGRWRFLPRSALVYDAELGFINYVNNADTPLNDSRPVRSRIGFNGLITNHFGLLAMAGWGGSFYAANPATPTQDFDSVIAHGEFKWFILPQPRLPEDGAKVGLSSVALGYTRNFTDSYLTDYYQRDRVYLNFSYFFAGVFLLSAEGGWSHMTYPESFFAPGTLNAPADFHRHDPFTEDRLDAELFGEYRLSDSFGINTTLRYNANLDTSDNDVVVVPAAPPDPNDPNSVATPAVVDNLAFTRFQAFLGVRWFM